jgi:Uma2 family endonuclease
MIAQQVYRLTVKDYHALGDSGAFEGQRVELLNGKIVKMPPKKDAHSIVTSLVAKQLRAVFDDQSFWVRTQEPLTLNNGSEPEPDIAVVEGSELTWLGKGHPRTALLVVEVSDSTLRYDRTTKAIAYARADISDYWVVNLVDRQLEVYRKSAGKRYDAPLILKPGQSIAPLAMKSKKIKVSELLP